MWHGPFRQYGAWRKSEDLIEIALPTASGSEPRVALGWRGAVHHGGPNAKAWIKLKRPRCLAAARLYSTRCPNDEVPWPRVPLFCLLRLCIACIPHQPHMEMDHAAPPELPPETVSQLASWPTGGTGLQKEVASKGSVGLKEDPLSDTATARARQDSCGSTRMCRWTGRVAGLSSINRDRRWHMNAIVPPRKRPLYAACVVSMGRCISNGVWVVFHSSICPTCTMGPKECRAGRSTSCRASTDWVFAPNFLLVPELLVCASEICFLWLFHASLYSRIPFHT